MDMTFFEQIFKRLFSGKNKGKSAALPYHSELINRNISERGAYFKWLQGQEHQPLLSHIYQAYQAEKKQASSLDPHVNIYNTPYSNGLAIYYQEPWEHMAFQHLFDLLRDKVTSLGYRLSVSDRKLYDQENAVKTVEKHYLKPTPAAFEPGQVLNQMYGNILLEYILINQKPNYIKLMANVYAGRNYSQAKDFDELIEKLFN
ncbi:hypothetical protein AAG747_13950 [Rapidithrix thailandica]|uniref:Uncharacterized protein n=1 Tax=Rapidithrix thailandica TaxID=413964 RepID=A0AAW9S686_9BACT